MINMTCVSSSARIDYAVVVVSFGVKMIEVGVPILPDNLYSLWLGKIGGSTLWILPDQQILE